MSDERMTALLNEMQQANEQSERAALRYMNDVYRKTILRTAAAMQAGGQRRPVIFWIRALPASATATAAG